MDRKNIAVCVTGYNWEYESRVVDGIYKRCQQLDINLLVFAALLIRPELNSDRVLPEEIILGEIEIFNLINYDMLDGIAVLGDSMIQEDVIYKISQKAAEHNIPTVNINDLAHKLKYNVILSDKSAMETIVTHLIEDHNVTKINFIGGFPGNLQTEERLSAYKKVLNKHNIPIEKNRIAYGEFWLKAAECTEEFMKSEDKPQAIVCASDTMAIFSMERLKKLGYRIPEDVIVTGFDGIKDCEMYTPLLTTVRRAFSAAGVRTVDIIRDIWEGRSVNETEYVKCELLKRQSCGCEKKSSHIDFYKVMHSTNNRYKEFNTYLLELNTKFANAKNSIELYSGTIKGADFFGLKKLYICINSNIRERFCNIDYELDKSFKGLSENVVSMVQYGHEVPIGYEFPAQQLLPESFLGGEKPVLMAFSPLYFKNSFLGYLAYEPSKLEGNGDLFGSWTTSISNNAGCFYMNNELEYLVAKLDSLNVRDPLTSLYNRRGMVRYGEALISQAKKGSGRITIICADIDNLKPINDKYGHEAGDVAITKTAEAILNSMPQGSVCTRTGGDEFCVILSGAEETEIQSAIERVDKTLEEYNNTGGLPFKIACSCGYHIVNGKNIGYMDEMVKLADKEMYKVKAAKKTARRN